ncbi:MAG: HEPN domain-containing protein [Chloroflexia bacterium]|nr:HEPN domain-containing protein [Chloroflexia bacterium]
MGARGDVRVGRGAARKGTGEFGRATSEFDNGRYKNVANRAYYACFQAAVAALDHADIRPSAAQSEWGHGFVQAQFAGHLVNRRKRYPAELRDVLSHALRLRERADYQRSSVSRPQAARLLARARTFVAQIEEGQTR